MNNHEWFIVICRTDRSAEDDTAGGYVLATRHLFPSVEQAAKYAGTVNSSREPLVVSGRFMGLRVED